MLGHAMHSFAYTCGGTGPCPLKTAAAAAAAATCTTCIGRAHTAKSPTIAPKMVLALTKDITDTIAIA